MKPRSVRSHTAASSDSTSPWPKGPLFASAVAFCDNSPAKASAVERSHAAVDTDEYSPAEEVKRPKEPSAPTGPRRRRSYMFEPSVVGVLLPPTKR